MFGSHLSVSGGLHKALDAAEALGLETLQVFTQAPAQWKLTPVKYPVGQVLTNIARHSRRTGR
jgi:endonuclease IV